MLNLKIADTNTPAGKHSLRHLVVKVGSFKLASSLGKTLRLHLLHLPPSCGYIWEGQSGVVDEVEVHGLDAQLNNSLRQTLRP